MPYLLLAIPFVVMIVLFRGLTQAVPTFHCGDELTAHYPVILSFNQQFPHINLADYPSTAGPFYYLLFVVLGKTIGFELYKLRLVNALISYLAVTVLYRFLAARLKFPRSHAFWLALVFAVSPYFFGISFLLLTDNLAFLLCFLTLDYLWRFKEGAGLGRLAVSCVFLALCLITRQLYFWLVPVAGLVLVNSPYRLRDKLTALSFIGLALVPLVGFVLLWKGLVPPTFKHYQNRTTFLYLRPVNFSLAVLGMYCLFLNPQQYFMFARQHPSRVVAGGLQAGCVAVGCLLLLVFPTARIAGHDNGLLWRLSEHLPVVLGSGIIFWLLVPAALMAVVFSLAGPDSDLFSLVILGSFLVVMMANTLQYQKYFDPFMLLAAAMLIRGRVLATRLNQIGYAVLVVLFIGYAMSHCYSATAP